MLNGTSCGRLKPNPRAALVYLQEINRSGEIDVSREIQEVLKIVNVGVSESDSGNSVNDKDKGNSNSNANVKGSNSAQKKM